ncbi:hypothetical protein LTR37_001808 [Vermiconidia calcicola]|uniref:Uncharacterized protein n=1 Tax=Vermiconidia calcicola TaxID=1690605 RepID=A0ACC3NUT1_9PEZI|nr:hypothetical protein LTR37_001808 [Vermiconidia calcicola]
MDSLKGAASGATNTVSSGAEQASSGLQNTASTAGNTASSGAEKASSTAQNPSSVTSGTKDWDAMTEEQKKATYDALPEDKKHSQGYVEWLKEGYQNKMENWMPWVEDQYLKWFTSDNKASYAAKDSLDKTKVTGIDQVDTAQDSVNNTVGGQVGQGGLLQPVGDAVSKEGVNRAERGGKDDSGSYGGAVGGAASSAGSSVWGGAKSVGGYVGGMLPGGGKKDGSAQ